MQTLDAIRGRRKHPRLPAHPGPPRDHRPDPRRQPLDARAAANRQNWRVTVATGEPLQRLVERMDERVRETPAGHVQPGQRPPRDPGSACRPCGPACSEMADALGKSLWEFIVAGSYRFFDAPVVLAVSHRGQNAANIAPFVTTLLIAAHDLGLGTIWLGYPLGAADLIQEELGIPEDEKRARDRGAGLSRPGFAGGDLSLGAGRGGDVYALGGV